jgi:hypothetical protein
MHVPDLTRSIDKASQPGRSGTLNTEYREQSTMPSHTTTSAGRNTSSEETIPKPQCKAKL